MNSELEALKKKRQEYVQKQDWPNALLVLNQMIQIEPTFERYHNRSVILAKLGKYEDALKNSQMALKIQPYSPKAQKTLILIERQQEQQEQHQQQKEIISTEETIDDPIIAQMMSSHTDINIEEYLVQTKIRAQSPIQPEDTKKLSFNEPQESKSLQHNDIPSYEQTAKDHSTSSSRETTLSGKATNNEAKKSTFINLEDYQIIKEIGSGGMGKVYLAQDTKFKRQVALKTLLHHDAKSIKRFLREAEALARLSHPNIIPIHSITQKNDQHFLVMDYIEGKTLAEYATNEDISWRTIMEIMRKITTAVDYIHEQGIIHRDLKPQNIMIRTQDHEPLIMDFGLAYVHENSTRLSMSGDIIGTPAYMSPEQISQTQEITELSDIYSLGVILYQLITKRLPFTGANNHKTMEQILNYDPKNPRKINTKIPKEIANICLKAMAKTPSYRYQSAREFRDDIQLYLEGKMVTAMPPGIYYQIHKWIGRNPMMAKMMGLFLVVVVSITFYSYYQVTTLLYKTQITFYKTQQQRDHTNATSVTLQNNIDTMLANEQQINKMVKEAEENKIKAQQAESTIRELLQKIEQEEIAFNEEKKAFALMEEKLLKFYLDIVTSKNMETIKIGLQALELFPNEMDQIAIVLLHKWQIGNTMEKEIIHAMFKRNILHIKDSKIKQQINELK